MPKGRMYPEVKQRNETNNRFQLDGGRVLDMSASGSWESPIRLAWKSPQERDTAKLLQRSRGCTDDKRIEISDSDINVGAY